MNLDETPGEVPELEPLNENFWFETAYYDLLPNHLSVESFMAVFGKPKSIHTIPEDRITKRVDPQWHVEVLIRSPDGKAETAAHGTVRYEWEREMWTIFAACEEVAEAVREHVVRRLCTKH